MVEELIYTITEVMEHGKASRNTVYDEINSGNLRAVKRGRRTFVLAEDLNVWLDGMKPYKPANTNVEASNEIAS